MPFWDAPWPADRPLSWWEYYQLLAAEDRRLHHDSVTYSVHGISNNALAMIWGGLLADGHGEVVLTDAGRTRLAQEKARRMRDEDQTDDGRPPFPATSGPTAAAGEDQQLDLFATT